MAYEMKTNAYMERRKENSPVREEINVTITSQSKIYVASAYIYNSSDVYISKEIYNFS